MPAVSVVVPLYNKAPYVERTLRSILRQTFHEYEILVVDDGSTDGGMQLVHRMKDPKIFLTTQANAGPGAARNRGLELARGKFVAFLDADDEWCPEYLERSLSLLKLHDSACVSSGYILLPRDESTEGFWRRRGLRDGVFRLTPATHPQEAVYRLAYMSSWNTVAKTDSVRKWGGFFAGERCLYGEDSFLWIQILLNERVAIRLKPLVQFHAENSALSHNLPGPRPIEPVLLYPDSIRKGCPAHLREVLEDMLAVKAARTACMLSYWGQWREGRALLRRFRRHRSVVLRQRLVAEICAQPMGGYAGAVWRRFSQQSHVA